VEPPIFSAPEKGVPTFGIDLADQMTRDAVEVPRIMQKCCEAIEKYGIQSKGIYRISGTHSKIQKLKEKLDHGEYSVSTFCIVLNLGRCRLCGS
jgi:hypothetical protein